MKLLERCPNDECQMPFINVEWQKGLEVSCIRCRSKIILLGDYDETW